MENNTMKYFSRAASQFHSSYISSKQAKSGYEPSDTETDWRDTPPSDLHIRNRVLFLSQSQPPKINKSPVKNHRRQSSKTKHDHTSCSPSIVSPLRRRKSGKSPYQRTISPFSKSDRRKHISPCKPRKEEHDLDISYNINEEDEEIRRIGEKISNYSRRSKTAPRSRDKAPSIGEINEMVASMKIVSKGGLHFEETESISQGDIFFSRTVNHKIGGSQGELNPRPAVSSRRDSLTHYEGRSGGAIGSINPNYLHKTSSTTAGSTELCSRSSSKFSESSGGSLMKFMASRTRSQTDVWFSCVRKGSCRNSKSSPERRAIDEALFIQKAFVVEKLRQFWADKHQPRSLNGFICHKQQAQVLQQIVSYDNCPHILFKGPSGSGKQALAMAFLREIYGDPFFNVSHDLRYFSAQEIGPMKVVVPITSSIHHMELNVNLEANAKYAVMGLAKEISDKYAVTPEASNVNFKADYKVVLYEVDKAAENIQHLIKWIMDRYTDACKLILCCEDDVNILESVKNRCKIIKVEAPVTHEIMEVLLQIAKKENFDLSMSFAAKVATKSKQNLRKAIMALEACKAHNYPFVDDQPIPLGWEEILVELAAEILADPSPKRLRFVQVKIQRLLVEYVHPKLILLKLVEQFLKGIDASLKREVYYWHAYYDKRLPTGTSALLKLEEFVAKFMSIRRRGSSNRP